MDEDDRDDRVQFGQEPWRRAVTRGNLRRLKTLVQQRGLAVLTQNYINEYECTVTTPLLEAVGRQRMDMVRYLVEECSSVIDINACSDEDDEQGYTSLHIATRENNLELVRYLVEKGCNINAVTSHDEKTPLHMAVEEEHVDIVKYLIDTGLCDLDSATSTDSKPAAATALAVAVEQCENLEIVQYILERGPGTKEKMANRATRVLPTACERGNFEIAKYLIESHQADVNTGAWHHYDGYTPLIFACECGSLELVEYLVEKCHVNAQAYIGQERKTNPLLRACESGHLEIVQYLVEKCAANVETARGGNKESPPLHFACDSGKLDLVQYLVAQCRVDVEEKNKYGNTALHEAAQSLKLDVVQHLVEKCGSNVEATSNTQRTALHMLCDRSGADAIAIVKYFVDVCCVRVNVPNVKGETALHIASRERNVEVVQCLIQSSRVNINAVDTMGRTAMHSCIVGPFYGRDRDLDKCLPIAKILAAADMTVFDNRDNDNRTFLHLACKNGLLQLVQYLVQECRIDVNAACNVGETALHIASRRGHVEIVQCLTSLLHTDVNAADNNGRTALHNACSAVVNEERARHTLRYSRTSGKDENRCFLIVECLLRTGRVNGNAQDNQGKTALHHAVVNPREMVPHEFARQKYLRDVCFKIVQALVESGQVNIDTTDETGQTVLHYYCSFPNIDIPRCLLEQGHANMNAMDNEGRTAIHRAASIVRCTGGLRLVLFLVSRLSWDPVGHDDVELPVLGSC